MAIAEVVRERTRANPRAVTAVLSAVGYAVVIAAFAGLLPVPDLADETVELFGHLIAAINSLALASLLAGWWFIRRGDVSRHRTAMLTAFGLILLFLVVYVWKISGGFTQGFVVPPDAPFAAYAGVVKGIYLLLLVVHVFLSVVAVPVVLHAVVLGITYPTSELGSTVHPRVGRWAAYSWSVSLALGIVTYLLLNAYDSEPIGRSLLVLAAGTRPLLGPAEG